MSRRHGAIGACLLALALMRVCMGADQPATSPSGETPQQRDARLAWWREARFGLFMHWGIYAIPANEWKGLEKKNSPPGLGAEWIMYNAKIPVAEYEPLARQFNPVKFNADEWVHIAADAGMKYMVITAKHCDGFAMFASKASKYNIVDATPFGRDPMKELKAACDKQGMRLGFYYSHSWDWHEPDALGLDNTWDFPDRAKKDINKYLASKSLPQVKELLTLYKPAILWFDVPNDLKPEHSRQFLDLIRALQPDCVVNDRIGNGMGDYGTPEQFIPAGRPDSLFEVCMTLNNHWGYDKNDHHWKPAREVIHNLVDIVSKGGNYLLNVGPTAEGVFPPEAIRILAEVGQWMKVNGQSIYGTTAGPFAALPWGRCTAKPGKLYLHVLDWPADGRLLVPGLKTNVVQAHLLADAQHKPLSVTRAGEQDVAVALPGEPADPADTVVVLEIEGEPVVDLTPVLFNQPQYRNVFGASAAKLHGKTIRYGGRNMGQQIYDHIGSWKDAGDWASWDCRTIAPGAFDVVITCKANAAQQGNEYMVNIADQQLTGQVNATGEKSTFKEFKVGTVTISGPGRYELTVKPKTIKPGTALMDLHAVTLVPVRK